MMNRIKSIIDNILESPTAKFSLVFGSVIVVLFIALGTSMGVDIDISSEEEYPTENVAEKIKVFYSEGDEDAAYNYISNPGLLRNTKMPFVGAVNLNDRIDNYLKNKDYISEILKLSNMYEDGTVIYFDITVTSKRYTFSAEYDIRYDELTIKD